MGKQKKGKQNKQHWSEPKARKDLSVFKVAGSKVTKLKKKVKPVTTTLKKLQKKVQTDARTQKADATFSEVRCSIVESQQVTNQKKVKTKLEISNKEAPPDMDHAASEFAKL